MNFNVRKITYAAIAAAIVFVVTRLFAIPIPVNVAGAYINPGDAVIYTFAYLLGGPMAAVAAAIGSALSDLTVGAAAIYAPATFIIKGLMALVVGYLVKGEKFWLYVAACLLGGAIMTVGYFLYELFVFGPAVSIGNVLYNLIQWGGSVVIAAILYPVARRLRTMTYFNEI